eukprot:jgi/Tetstr1/438080/TSEL_026705.t1
MVLLLPLNVTTTREGWLRLSGYFSVMAILLVTATLSILYETTFLTVVDRDFRDMLWDYRTTQTGIARYHRMLGTAYWPTYLARVDDWEVDLLRPSEDIPTIVIYTGSTAACTRSIGSVSNNLCAQMEEAVDLAVSAHPGRLRVVREPSGSVSPVPQLEVFFLGVQQPEALISPNRVSIEEVDAFVAGVIDTYVDPQYKPPRVGSSYVALYNSVQVAGRNVPLSLMANSTQDKMRFLWPWELWPWPRPCTNTSYAENSLLGEMTLRAPALRLSNDALLVPRIQSTFLRSHSAGADWYSVEPRDNGTVAIGVLEKLVLRYAMVPQQGECCAWTLREAVGEYSQPYVVPLQEAPAALGSMNIELEVELRDTAQPVPPEFPRNKGPALIYCGIILGGISFILLGLTPILMFLVYHHVLVNSDLPPPFYMYSRKYRGW